MSLGLIVILRESAANDNLAVRLNGDGIDEPICATAKIDRSIRGAVWKEPGETAARHAIEAGKVTRHDQFAIRLGGDGIDNVIAAWQPLQECGVQAPIRVEPGQIIAGDSVHAGERAADD